MSYIPRPDGYDDLPGWTQNSISRQLDRYEPTDYGWTDLAGGGSIIDFVAANDTVLQLVLRWTNEDPIAVGDERFGFILNGGDHQSALVIEGLPEATNPGAYLQERIDKLIDMSVPGAEDVHRSLSLIAGKLWNSSTAIRTVGVISEAEVTLTKTSDADAVLVLNLNEAGGVVTEGFNEIVVVGGGEVRAKAEEGVGVRISADSRDQVLIGTDGDDVLLSAGGKDVFTGGAGNDQFAFAADFGHELTITDFGAGDMLLVAMDGVDDVEQLKARISSIDVSDDLVIRFDTGAVLTLIGVALDDLTADMVIFI